MIRFEQVGLRYEPLRGATGSTILRDTDQPGLAEPGEVLRDVSLTVPDGSFRWLLGPSGAGKSSLLRLMYAAIRPTRGRIMLLGADLAVTPRAALPVLRRRIGVVFQDFRLLPHLNAFDNVALPLRIAGRPEGQIRADVAELLRWVGLARKMNARPAELSGGEQQRVAIARAVIGRPALILADEPTGNLDEAQAERLMQLLKELNRLGTTIVVATHNDGLVARHPAPALRLAHGHVLAEDTGWTQGMIGRESGFSYGLAAPDEEVAYPHASVAPAGLHGSAPLQPVRNGAAVERSFRNRPAGSRFL
ncbi:cell division ATP-binding protein FtsE [Granulibacter bethesdensis]|uniref:Cell division ATP-binding protein FtsE n=1 Tax=Granulibacter bethesdensis (strain ATCC BAA-1260 / CGDNIH1) TaxID=391165 RepID=Q0BVX3_GRABC|nr:Cell division ATP-binding protein ftsE [Granulibacter bethesdensis CGDNIH1]AHJ64502.1 Cell division ATP-binding protein ftsE [Granulibacter bethesdensis CGDNIH4]AHJ67119.1 Cell division ATP-binding protein ftsE [Granulibacter bethesdensis]APH50804.1 Cell division ATP-binding protein ftsE [Granulibacter bethesdensis]APH58424.1 Cell division ATP-binding protein ftsE [Granulibacter bethesdensis]